MRTRTPAVVTLLLAVLVVGAVVAGAYLGRADTPDDGAEIPATQPPEPGEVDPPEGLVLPAARTPGPVLRTPAGPALDPAALRSTLAPLLGDANLGRHVGVAVRDLSRDRAVLTVGGTAPFVPASTLKLFTAAAALAELGPAHRFETTVQLDRSGPGVPTVVLVGGGDPLLARQQPDPGTAFAPDVSGVVSVDLLAAQTARFLRDAGVRRVRVGWDASMFSGPSVSPQWQPSYVPDEVVSPISALWVDEGRLGLGFSDRSPDPAEAAAAELVDGLEGRGIGVVGAPAVSDGAEGEVAASGRSAPLDEIVTHVLEVSDNEGAEVLLRHVALANGRPGSFAAGGAAVEEVLTGLGVPWDAVVVHDGSGLSRNDRVTLRAVTAVLALGADPDLPELRTLLSGLPVARFTGSLVFRFVDDGTAAGRGLVRAKTGTLTGVHGLAGTVVTRDDSRLAFALLTDQVRPIDTLDARAQLDRMAAALAGCGCRRPR